MSFCNLSLVYPLDRRFYRRGATPVGREAREERDVARIAEEPDGADCDDVENRIESEIDWEAWRIRN